MIATNFPFTNADTFEMSIAIVCDAVTQISANKNEEHGHSVSFGRFQCILSIRCQIRAKIMPQIISMRINFAAETLTTRANSRECAK